MKKLIFITMAMLIIAKSQGGVPPGATGIGVSPPKAMLHVKGEILIDSARSTPVQDGMIQYKTNQFLFRQNGAWLPLGSGGAGNAGSGMTKRNDTLIAGGRLKDLLIYKNATDTIFAIDTLGNMYLPKIQEFVEDDESYHIDSNLTATRNSLKDSLVHWVFNDNADIVCYGDSTGTTQKIKFRDNNRLIIDTLHFGNCTGTQYFTLLMWKASPYTVPSGYFVDTFGVFFSGYDTLNMEGDASGGGKGGYWFVSDGHKTLDDPNDVGDPFSQLGNPFPIPGDTIGFLNRMFGEEKTYIDSLYVGVLIPIRGIQTDYKQIIDRIAFIYTLKPYIYSLGIAADRVVKLPKSSSNYTAGNGINFRNTNEIELGDINTDTYLYGNNHNLSYGGLNSYGITASSPNNTGMFQSGTSGSAIGNDIEGYSTGNIGLYQRGQSNTSQGVSVYGQSSFNSGIYIYGSNSSPSTGIGDIVMQPANGNMTISNLRDDNSGSKVLSKDINDYLVWKDASGSSIAAGSAITNNSGTFDFGGYQSGNSIIEGTNNYSTEFHNQTEFKMNTSYMSGMYNTFGMNNLSGFSIRTGSIMGHPLYGQNSEIVVNENNILLQRTRSTSPGFGVNDSYLNLGDSLAVLAAGYGGTALIMNSGRATLFGIPDNIPAADCDMVLTKQTANHELAWLDKNTLSNTIYNSDGNTTGNRSVKTGPYSISIGRDLSNGSAEGSVMSLDSASGYFTIASSNSVNGNVSLIGVNNPSVMYISQSTGTQTITNFKDSIYIGSSNINYAFNGEESDIILKKTDIRMGNRFRGVKDFTIIHSPLGASNAPGLIGINTDAPLTTFHINTTDGMIIPKGTTGQRPTGVDGMFRFNTSTNGYEGYYSSGWQPFNNMYNADGSVTTNRTVDFTNKNLTFNGNIGAASRFYIQASENGAYAVNMGSIRSQGTSTNNFGIWTSGASSTFSGHYIGGATTASSGSGYKGIWMNGTATENNVAVEIDGYNSGTNSAAVNINGQSGPGYNHTDARSVQIFGDAIVEIGSIGEYVMLTTSAIAPNPSFNTDLGRKVKPFDSTYTNQVVATGIHTDSIIAPVEIIPPGYFTPADGATISLTKSYNIVEPAGTLTALTVNMPSSPKNGQIVSIVFTQIITSLTFANGTFVNPITTSSTVGGTVTWGYYSGTSSWYRK